MVTKAMGDRGVTASIGTRRQFKVQLVTWSTRASVRCYSRGMCRHPHFHQGPLARPKYQWRDGVMSTAQNTEPTTPLTTSIIIAEALQGANTVEGACPLPRTT